MIRCILVVLELLIFLIFMIPSMLILMLLRRVNLELSSNISQAIVRFIFKVMLVITGSKVEVIGKEHIPNEGGVLFVSNHRSYFDILVGFSYTPKIFGFVAKSEMMKYPVLNIWMTLVNCLFLDRNDIKKAFKTILKGIDNVKHGISVWICPEGTRNRAKDNLNIGEFKEGSLKIAEKSGCAIIPVAIYGTSEIFEQHIPRMKASKVTIEYGKPIYIKQLDAENKKMVGAYTRGIILEMLTRESDRRKETIS